MNQTPEQLAAWLESRTGKLTASNMAKVLAVGKDGKPLKARADLIRDLLAERYTGVAQRHFVTAAMEHGLAYEDEAKSAYEARTGALITPCGFYDHPQIDMFGATPDGLLGDDGLIEIKCPTTPTFVEWRLAGVLPKEYQPQMLAQMACTGRRWCEFVAYDPRIRQEPHRLFIRRFEPAASDIEQIECAARIFLAEVEIMWDHLVAAG